MDISDIITNPIVIGLVGGLITYIYMRWRNEKKKKKDVNLMIPFAVFVVCWFISYAYFSSIDSSSSTTSTSKLNSSDKIDIKIIPSTKTTTLQSSTSEPQEFELVSKTNGVHIPNELPDIFHEMAN